MPSLETGGPGHLIPPRIWHFSVPCSLFTGFRGLGLWVEGVEFHWLGGYEFAAGTIAAV